MVSKFISFLVAAALLFLLAGTASAHYVAIFPANSQPESINVTTDNYYFNVNDTTNLYLYIIHPLDSNYAEIGPDFEIGMNLIAPDGTVKTIPVQRSAGNVTYDTGEKMATANWYVGNVTLNQEGVYYVEAYQKGYTDGAITRERYTFAPLYVGNSTTGWDNIKDHKKDATVVVYPMSVPKGITSSLKVAVDGDLNWFLKASDENVTLHDPLPIVAEVYQNPAETKANGAAEGTYEHLDADRTKTFTFNTDGVWFIIALNQEHGEDQDSFQSVYMIPVGTPKEESSVPGIGFFGILACFGLAGAVIIYKRK